MSTNSSAGHAASWAKAAASPASRARAGSWWSRREADRLISDSAWRRHQMPAYHLMAPGRTGITLVNIGVGPSNAKTIADHLAVLRPEAWLMIGHCGGLRPSQRIGDYVLAHAYLRDDHIMDDVLPPEIPIPAIAEVQLAIARAAETISGQSGDELKLRLRTGTIVTTDDRNWELRYSPRPCASRSAARWASTWNRPRSPHRAIASGCPTAPCSASRTSRSTASSSSRPGQPLLRARDQRASPHRH
jgi:nucleoside phosphorylase